MPETENSSSSSKKGSDESNEPPAGVWDSIQALLLKNAENAQRSANQTRQDDANEELRNSELSSRMQELQASTGSEYKGQQLLRQLAYEANKQLSLDDASDPGRRLRILEEFLQKASGKDMSYYNTYASRILLKFPLFKLLFKDKSKGAENREKILLKLMTKTNNLFQVLTVLDICPTRYLSHPLALMTMQAPLDGDYDIKLTMLTLHIGIQRYLESINRLSRTLAFHELHAATNSVLSAPMRNPAYTRVFEYQNFLPEKRNRRPLTNQQRLRVRALQRYIPILQRENAFWKCKLLNAQKTLELQPDTKDDLAYRIFDWGTAFRGMQYVYNYLTGSGSNNPIQGALDSQLSNTSHEPPLMSSNVIKKLVSNYFQKKHLIVN